MKLEIPYDLVHSLIEDIEQMGNDAPLSLKRLWGHLNEWAGPGFTARNDESTS